MLDAFQEPCDTIFMVKEQTAATAAKGNNMTWYTITGKDAEGFTVVERTEETTNKKDAIKLGKDMLHSEHWKEERAGDVEGLVLAEVTDEGGEVIWDDSI